MLDTERDNLLRVCKSILSIYTPEYWFLCWFAIVKSFVVCNDVAERGVSLGQEFNNIVTQDEEQKQLIFKKVFDHRQKFPSCKKSELC